MNNFDNLPATLGDYELKILLSNDGCISTYQAVQTLIHRDVILCLLNPESTTPENTSAFLESARIKARVKEGRICSVFEATCTNGQTYYTQELPAGENLEKLATEGLILEPLQATRIIKELAVSQLYYEKHSFSVSPWTPSSLFLDKNQDPHFLNLVIAGQRLETETPRDMAAAGDSLSRIVAPGLPGSTRVQTLCAWMRGGNDAPRGLNWAMVLELCDTIIDQLTAATLSTTSPYSRPARKSGKSLWIFSLCALIIAAAVGITFFKKNNQPPQPPADPGRILKITEGNHRSETILSIYDNSTNTTRKLSVDVHEVTIASYERFLNFISKLSPSQLALFHSPEQPESKISYVPADWGAMLASINTGEPWNGHILTRQSPVTNVDYWDAVAYAKWADRRLMTEQEWQLILGEDKTQYPTPDEYGPVTSYKNDITESGIGGMCRGVAEWTSTKSVDLAMPMSGKKPVLCGGSYTTKGNASSIDYAESESTTRPDLGFRTVNDITEES